MMSSDEAVFGNKFFEPIAQEFSDGGKSGSEGVDITVITDKKHSAYAVKSGPNPFNASTKAKQNLEFNALRSRLLKTNKQFDAILAYSYGNGNKLSTYKRIYREVAGQHFWEEITDDEEFYIKLIEMMKTLPSEHMKIYKKIF